MRRDVSVTNDSGGLSLISSTVVDRVIEDNRENDQAFAEANDVVLFALPGDESFIARVVVGEPLTAAEEAAWVACVRTRLKIPCGRLLVCGGFDPRRLESWRDEGETEDDESCVREVKVPPGEYRVDLYSHMSSLTASFVREEWRETVGAWFRREHPNTPFPQWLAEELKTSPEEDPGHETEWEDMAAAVKSGALRVENAPEGWIQYLVHLRSATSDVDKLSERGDDGWFDYTTGTRLPARFPHALPAEEEEDVPSA